MKKKAIPIFLVSVVLTVALPAFGAAAPAAPASTSIQMPVASGTDVKAGDTAEIDYSHTSDGYFMVKSLDASKQMKVMVKDPGGTSYTYTLKTDGNYEAFPFSEGNGNYNIGVYEQLEGTRYATVVTMDASVSLSDQFAPFIRPNQYVNYSANSKTVAKANELVAGKTDFLEKVSAIYNFTVDNIKYDEALAATVKSGYVPVVDNVLAKGTGICFDYAAVMTAMLRSQSIPTKLVIGYTGQIYHAWISVYSEETGWIDNIIQFDGNTWELMDPTFASTGGQSEEVMQYIGTGTNYSAKYFY